MVKGLPAVQESWVRSLGWEDPLEKERQSTPVFLPGEFHGQGSLAGYHPWGHKESNATKTLLLTPGSLLNSLLILASPLNLPDGVGGPSPVL